MSSLNNPAWLQFKPLTAVGKLRTYVSLPAFSYTPNFTVGSELVTQFNFSASQSFYLKNKPAKPSGVNYLLCIKYREGTTVFRYKLWAGVGEIGMDEVPVYSNQIIKKNFVLEVWSVGNAASQSAAINLITSVTQIPTDISTLSDVALAVGAEFNNYTNIVTAVDFPKTIAYYWYRSQGVVDTGGGFASSWTQEGTAGTSPANDLVPQGANPAIIAGPNNLGVGVRAANMLATIALVNSFTIVMVCKINTYNPSSKLFNLYTNGTGTTKSMSVIMEDNSPELKGQLVTTVPTTLKTTVIGEVPVNTWGVLSLRSSNQVNIKFSSNNAPEVLATSADIYVQPDRFALDKDGLLDVAHILIFKGIITDDQLNQIYSYMLQTFGLGFQIPLTFNTGLEWLDNI